MVFKGMFISYVKTRKMISKRCIYHFVQVRDVESNVSTLYLVHIISEFPDIFPDDLFSIPLQRKIDFGIDFLPDT